MKSRMSHNTMECLEYWRVTEGHGISPSHVTQLTGVVAAREGDVQLGVDGADVIGGDVDCRHERGLGLYLRGEYCSVYNGDM